MTMLQYIVKLVERVLVVSRPELDALLTWPTPSAQKGIGIGNEILIGSGAEASSSDPNLLP